MIIDNTTLWNTYNALSSEKEKHSYLKNYLLSLPPEDLYHYILADVDTLGLDMIDLITKGDLQPDQSLELDDKLNAIINNVGKKDRIAKAA